MFSAAFRGFIDFLFPKSDAVYELESLSPGELAGRLPKPENSGGDTLSLFSYSNERMKEIVWEIKYRKNPRLAKSLGILLYAALKDFAAEKNLDRPLLIPVPMSRRRFLERGWNQTEILCEEIKRLDAENLFEYRSDALRKVRHTESQTQTENREERVKNIKGSMEAWDVKGRNVIVLDDVTTTGSTFREARRALRESGAGSIFCVSLAH